MTVGPHSSSKPSAAALANSEATAVKQTICEETCRIVVPNFSSGLRSIVLAGSMARDEATIEKEPQKLIVLGDADFFLIFNETAHEPSSALLEKTMHEVEGNLLARGIHAHIALCSVRSSYLQGLPPYIATYELRSTGQVIWGDKNILSLIPAFPASQISKEDAWRMLCNRLIEFLEHVPGVVSSDEGGHAFRYATVKLLLDTATSYLVFIDQYEPTYLGRVARLRGWSIASPKANALPLPLPEFTHLVSRCTQWKLSGTATAAVLPWREVLACAEVLWRWELVQLTGAPASFTDDALWSRWSRQQTFWQRLRGWLSVALRCSWNIRLKRAPRWTRLSFRATPRYCIYRVATETLWHLLRLPGDDALFSAPGVDWRKLRAFLPEPAPMLLGDRESWQHLAAVVAWNYREFLTGTLA